MIRFFSSPTTYLETLQTQLQSNLQSHLLSFTTSKREVQIKIIFTGRYHYH